MSKSFEDQMEDKIQKGGKPAEIGEVRDFGGKQFQKMGNGEWKPYVHAEEKQLEAEQNKNKVVSLTDKLKSKIAEKKEVSASSQHLSDLQNQAVIPNQQTRSEKPMFTNVEAALAHGYDAKDFREVGNFFYDRAQKMAENIAKLEQTKQKVDPNYEKIKTANLKMAKQFISQGNRVDDRQAKTKAMSKSIVMMGHNDAAEVDTAKFAQELNAVSEQGWWLEMMQDVMREYQYGDVPRIITMDQGDLYLVRVDDGLYSGVFKRILQTEDGVMEDNSKTRIERMSLPSLVSFCLAKEWIKSTEKVNPGLSYAAQMDYYGGSLDAADRQDKTVDQLIEKLDEPVPEQISVDTVHTMNSLISNLEAPVVPVQPVESDLDKRIRMLELLTKLTN